MIYAWELKFYPTNKYPKRYRLRLKCTTEDIEEIRAFLKNELSVDVSPSFNVLSSNYDLGIYIYSLSDEQKEKFIESLKSICQNGIVDEKAPSAGSELGEQKSSGLPDDLSNVLTGLVEQISSKAIEQDSQNVKKVTKSGITEGMPLNPRYTFENFVVGTNNRFTHAAALAVAENPGKTYNPLFIYGGVGLGKTHLMQAIGHYIKKKRPMLKVVYIPSDKFVGQVIDAIRNGTIRELREAYTNADALLVDDIQFMAESESTQEEFFHIFNTLHQMGKQIVLTSDRPPKLLATLEDRLRSRFEWGLIADIKSPSLETRVAILKKKSEEENVNVDDNILLYVASKLKSNIRELEGFLKRITAYATLNNQPVDIQLVKQLMSELLPEEELTEEEKLLVKKEEVEIPKQKEVVKQQTTIPEISHTVEPQQQFKPKEKPQPTPTSKPQSQIQQEVQKVVSVPEIRDTQPQPQVKQPVSTEEERFYQSFETSSNVVEAAFFYPENAVQELSLVKQKFEDIIKKHNLKYKLVTAFDRPYTLDNINYRMFVELCKTNKVNVCIVISPPSDSSVSADEFYNNLLPLMETEGIALEYINWKEINKEYRYLNLALDIALSKFKLT